MNQGGWVIYTYTSDPVYDAFLCFPCNWGRILLGDETYCEADFSGGTVVYTFPGQR